MIETFHERDKVLTRYLFNELGAAERSGLEDEMLLDEELFERVESVEMTLIDGYVRGEMMPEESLRFERRFMGVPENREKVNRARMFHKSLHRLHEQASAATPMHAPRRGWLRRLSEFFRRPLPALALTAATLLLICGGLYYAWRLSQRSQANPETVVKASPSPIVPPQKTDHTPTPNNSPTPNSSPTPAKVPPVGGGVEIARNDRAAYTKEVYLFREEPAGVERGGGDAVPITLDKRNRYLKLVHELLDDIQDRETFAVTIHDRDGDPIELKGGQKRQMVKTVRRKEAGRLRRFISVEVPVRAFKDDGPYKFEIDEPNFSPALFTIKMK